MANTGKTGGTSRIEGMGTHGENRGGQKNLSDVADQGKQMATAAGEKAQDLSRRATEMAGNVGQVAGQAVASVGGQMENLAGTIRESAPREGMVGSVASTVADSLEAGGQYLREQDLADIGADVTNLIRQYPIQSVLVGVGVGFLLARATRS